MNKKAVIGPKDADNIALEPERLGPGAPGAIMGHVLVSHPMG